MTTTVETTTTVEILTKAKGLIGSPEAWIKGDWHNIERTKFCAVGAVQEVAGGSYGKWRRFLTAAIPGDWLPTPAVSRECDREDCAVCHPSRENYTPSVEIFNDDEATTHEDVMAMFDRAIEAAKAEEA